ncbi:MAG: response regulator transcription factor [Gammaproteobacteria bacterium]|nr:response regulator transcription factor [Gammaproteobacteria bacterium]MDH5736268.1 response regulator transcription factor [Gammaproteobacteria bacterium]
MEKRILIVEDDRDICHLIKMHLQEMAEKVSCHYNGLSAWQDFQQHNYNLVVLDIMLPVMDGLEVCKKIRASDTAYTPILMLTSRSSEMDRILGLELGADDYLTKPFSLLELVARVKALFRRAEAMQLKDAKGKKISFNGLFIDSNSRQVIRDGVDLELTVKEFDLLMHFAQHPGQVFNRLQLLDQVWGYSHEGYEHTVNSHINRLRSKLETDSRNPRYIKTVWGVGYQFISQPSN